MSKLIYKVWKTPEEGLSILEEAAGDLGATTWRLNRNTSRGIYVGSGIVQPVEIPSRSGKYRRFCMRGFRTYHVTKNERGTLCLGKVLYEGMDPHMAIQFATGKLPLLKEEDE